LDGQKRYIQNRITKKMEGSYSVEGRDNIPDTSPTPLSVLPISALPANPLESETPTPLYESFKNSILSKGSTLTVSPTHPTIGDLERSKKVGLEMLEDPMIVSMIRQSPDRLLSNPILAPLVYALAERDLAESTEINKFYRDKEQVLKGTVIDANSTEKIKAEEILPSQKILDAVITEERPTPLPIQHRVLLGYTMETGAKGNQVRRKVYLRVSGEVAVNRPDPKNSGNWKLQELRPESYKYWEDRAINVSKTLWDYWEGKGLHETLQAVPFRKVVAEEDELSPYIEVLETNGDYVRYYDNPNTADGTPCLAYLMPVTKMPKLLQQYMKEQAESVWPEYECDPMRVEFLANREDAIKENKNRYSKWDIERPENVIWITELDDNAMPIIPKKEGV
jgi:hypothetical protein